MSPCDRNTSQLRWHGNAYGRTTPKKGTPFGYTSKHGVFEKKVPVLCDNYSMEVDLLKYLHTSHERASFSGMAASIVAKPTRREFLNASGPIAYSTCPGKDSIFSSSQNCSDLVVRNFLEVKIMKLKHCPSKLIWWNSWLNIVEKARDEFM